MSDPLVISALENGEPKLMAGQAEALLDKLDRLLRLRLPAGGGQAPGADVLEPPGGREERRRLASLYRPAWPVSAKRCGRPATGLRRATKAR
ncbi:hypothetical protein P4200_29740 [Pseudomonas aeruginosa]|nr:hypothetical protein [Pseudomonas aeruginosa]